MPNLWNYWENISSVEKKVGFQNSKFWAKKFIFD